LHEIRLALGDQVFETIIVATDTTGNLDDTPGVGRSLVTHHLAQFVCELFDLGLPTEKQQVSIFYLFKHLLVPLTKSMRGPSPTAGWMRVLNTSTRVFSIKV